VIWSALSAIERDFHVVAQLTTKGGDERCCRVAQEHGVHASDDHREALVHVRPHGISREPEDPNRHTRSLTRRPDALDRRTDIRVIDGTRQAETR
jgi:hypothetical protein